MMQILIFGLSGQVGDALLPLLRESGHQVTAVSRQQKSDEKNIAWWRAGFSDFVSPMKNYDAIISLGPLDAFAAWLARAGITSNKIVALSSTSIVTKKNSPDCNERKLAGSLFESEKILVCHAGKTASSLIILRPTLIYGAGRDQSLSRWINMARRFKFLLLPKKASGLRQPVHVADVAAAVFKSLSVVHFEMLTLDLPGGETLPFDQMLLRSLQVHSPATKVMRIPNFLFRFVVQFASMIGLIHGLGSGFFARLHEDWLFDATQAGIELDYRPRPFSP